MLDTPSVGTAPEKAGVGADGSFCISEIPESAPELAPASPETGVIPYYFHLCGRPLFSIADGILPILPILVHVRAG